jgi:hypothetical protein
VKSLKFKVLPKDSEQMYLVTELTFDGLGNLQLIQGRAITSTYKLNPLFTRFIFKPDEITLFQNEGLDAKGNELYKEINLNV